MATASGSQQTSFGPKYHHNATLRIEEPDANAIGGQDRIAVTERQRSSRGKGKVLGGGRDSYSGGPGDIVISKTGTEVHLRGPITDAWSHGDKWKSNAAALDPEALYTSKIAQNHSAVLAVVVALKKLASSPEEASKAIDQFTNIFSQKKLLFGSLEARSSALRGQTSPADWWNSYGGQCKNLQKLAMRIVSQCNSSSGCERNWSTFALVHTKLRNKLSYDKLMKLVYVHYNLKLYIQQFEADFQSLKEKETDPYSLMMDAAFFDEANPIMDWLCHSRSESTPVLDEYDIEADDWTMPGGFLIDELQMDISQVTAFKRKLCFGQKGGKKKGKNVHFEEDEPEDLFEDGSDSDSPHGSPVYAESQDSSSASSDEGDDDVEGDKGDGTACVTKGDGAGASGSRVRGSSSIRVGRHVHIRPRSTRKKKPTLKSVKDL